MANERNVSVSQETSFLSVEKINAKKEFSLKKEALTEDLQDAIIETVSMARSGLFRIHIDHVLLQLYDNGCYGRLLTIP
jgi:hypothetical protein